MVLLAGVDSWSWCWLEELADVLLWFGSCFVVWLYLCRVIVMRGRSGVECKCIFSCQSIRGYDHMAIVDPRDGKPGQPDLAR